MKKNKYFIRCLICLFFCMPFCRVGASTYENAQRMLQNLEIAKAYQLMGTLVEKDENNGELLASLAYLDWHVYRDYSRARKHLVQLRTIQGNESLAHRMLSKVEQERGNVALSLYHARKSVQTALGDSEYLAAFEHYAKVLYERQRSLLLLEKEIEEGLLYAVHQELIHLLTCYPGELDLALLSLGFSLLLEDGEQALAALFAYYGFVEPSDVWPTLQRPIHLLQESLHNLGKSNLDVGQYKSIITGLAQSRFYEYAYVLLLRSPAEIQEKLFSDELVGSYILYARYLDYLKQETDDLYRFTAQNINLSTEIWKRKTIHEQRIFEKQKELLASLGFTESKSTSNEIIEQELYRRFGALGFVGATNSCRHYSRVLGHVVRQETVFIDQYGYEAEVVSLELDHLNTVGFPGWVHGILDVGGWSKGHIIISVRQAYAKKSLQAYLLVVDQEHRKLVQELADSLGGSADFETMCKLLSLQLTLQFVDELYESCAEAGFTGSELYRKFSNRFMETVQASAIYAHEGRHAIDQLYFPQEFRTWSNEKRELHAKYSELVFAADVRIVLSAMLHDLSNSDHGRANRTIIEMLQPCLSDALFYEHPIQAILSTPSEQIKQCIKRVDPLFLSRLQ